GKYRQRGKLQPPSSANRQELNDMYQVDIETFEGARLAAIEHRGDYQEIGKAFERVFANAVPQGLVGPATRSIGIYYDDAHSVPRNELRADAAIVVPANADVNGELRVIEIPAMQCPSVVHKGPYAELERPYEFLSREWLPQSGREPADHPCFEEYLNNAREHPPSEWLTRIYLPLRA